MADQLDGIHAELHARLAELRPLVDEHSRLDAASRALADGAPESSALAPDNRRPRSGASVASLLPSEGPAHTFTEPLARLVADHGDCVECERSVAAHEGLQAPRC